MQLKSSRGLTLVELLVGLAITAILLTLAVPNFSLWIRNIGIRNATSSILSGLQLARAEALKRNTQMRFQLTDSLDAGCSLDATGPFWVVSRDNVAGACDGTVHGPQMKTEDAAPRIVQVYEGSAMGKGSECESDRKSCERARIDADSSLFAFNGLGRLIAVDGGVPAGDAVINVYGADGESDCASGGGKARCLRIVVSPGGGTRMCDPALPTTDTQACL
ncbi:MAG: GspH/FimT family pseudopilin [Zoogloeaceae bacterium]|jgi:type IV fimbrial biogenesis protein FimT|nr:GspH/FimT family pseudopilin [Zoogloeaceae bacterium]